MNSKVKKTLAYMLCFSMIVSAGMTGVHSEEAPAEEDTSAADSADEAEEEEDDAEEEETPRTEEEAMALMTEVASNSNLKLYKNEDEGTIALEDLKTGKIWWSNPVDLETSNAKKSQKDELASGMTLIYGEPASRATTVQTSKAKGKFKMKDIPNGIEITYTYAGPGITIPVQLTLEEDYLKLYVDTSAIEEKNPSTVDGQLVTDLAFMTTFGAAGLDEDGYFVVPDGSGAVINFNNGKTGLKT